MSASKYTIVNVIRNGIATQEYKERAADCQTFVVGARNVITAMVRDYNSISWDVAESIVSAESIAPFGDTVTFIDTDCTVYVASQVWERN